MQTAAEVLSEDGPLARKLPGFAVRSQQQAMAACVEETLLDHGLLVCEAGTGTGKTYAYLAPALLSGRKVIISTGTRNLQDQLFHRDLPVLREALNVPVTVALLKGRANYLCLQRLGDWMDDGGSSARRMRADMQRIRGWAERTRSGDIAELSGIAEDSPAWPQVTSTSENCLGQECPLYEECHVLKARREAIAADVVVVNHHLFLADMALREEGFGELLPGADAVIFDEAHQLPELASHFFSTMLSSRQLLDLSRDAITAEVREAGDMPGLQDAARAMETAVRNLRLDLGQARQRGGWTALLTKASIREGMDKLDASLAELQTWLERAAERGRELENCLNRVMLQRGRLAGFMAADDERPSPPADEGDGGIRWYETHGHGFTLHDTPMDIAPSFTRRREACQCAWVFTSATLAVGRQFSHFTRRLGIETARTERWDSPFDFTRQALLYLPAIALEPREPEYNAAVVAAAVPVLRASRGRAFFLFTSHRALREAAGLLQGELEYPLLIQGDAPRGELLQRFRDLGNAILLGTSSFWEGVDVRGEALSCVIIDKLPFAAPDDPVLQARLNAMREQGGNPFFDYQLPEAVIALKQGVGRLIRDPEDRGLLVICDPRLLSKPYGKVFLRALPKIPITQSIAGVADFFDVAGVGFQQDQDMVMLPE